LEVSPNEAPPPSLCDPDSGIDEVISSEAVDDVVWCLLASTPDVIILDGDEVAPLDTVTPDDTANC